MSQIHQHHHRLSEIDNGNKYGIMTSRTGNRLTTFNMTRTKCVNRTCKVALVHKYD